MADPLFPELAAQAATWVATYLLHSTLILTAVWIATRLHDFAPVIRDVLWKTALLAGVVTATSALLTEGMPPEMGEVIAIDRGGTPARAIRQVRIERDMIDTRRSSVVTGGTWTQAGLGEDIRLRADVAVSRSGLAGWPLMALFVAWLLIGTVGLVRITMLRRDLKLLRPHFTEPSPRTRLLLTQVATGVREVQLVRCDALEAPCVLPQRTIAIPGRCEAELSDGELRAVLGHELGHVARHDVLWTTLLRGLATILWIQPLNWLALHRVREAAELVCDDWAVERTGETYGLASSISRVAEWAATPSPALGLSMVGDSTRLAHRVKRILEGERSGTAPGWHGVTMVALLLLPSWWLPVVHSGHTVEKVTIEGRAVFVGDTVVAGLPAAGPAAGERHLIIAAIRPG